MAPKDFRYTPSWYVTSYIGQSFGILGSSEIRAGSGLNVGYAVSEPRFRFRRNPAQKVWEVYVNRSYSRSEADSPETNAVGVLLMSRWHSKRDDQGRGFFLDIGWGLQLANHETIDLDSSLNSTPTIDFGATYPMGKQECMFMIRYMHASNAGLKGDNRGNNLVAIVAGVRF